MWLNERPLDVGRRYLLKHTTQLLSANVTALRHRININTLETETASALEMNEIGLAEIETSKPIFFDAYERNRTTGSVVLIDAETNATVAAGMIVQASSSRVARPSGPVTMAERRARFGHGPAAISVGRRESLARLLERRLFDRGCAVAIVRDPGAEAVRALEAAGLIAIVVDDSEPMLPHDDERAADAVMARLFDAAQDWEKGRGI